MAITTEQTALGSRHFLKSQQSAWKCRDRLRIQSVVIWGLKVSLLARIVDQGVGQIRPQIIITT